MKPVYALMEEALVDLPGVEQDYKLEWDMVRFRLCGRMFAAQGKYKTGALIATFKVEPDWGELLCQQYPSIIPGYYMNKRHWISVFCDDTVPAEVIQDLVRSAYNLVRKSLPRKERDTLAGLTVGKGGENDAAYHDME